MSPRTPAAALALLLLATVGAPLVVASSHVATPGAGGSVVVHDYKGAACVTVNGLSQCHRHADIGTQAYANGGAWVYTRGGVPTAGVYYHAYVAYGDRMIVIGPGPSPPPCGFGCSPHDIAAWVISQLPRV